MLLALIANRNVFTQKQTHAYDVAAALHSENHFVFMFCIFKQTVKKKNIAIALRGARVAHTNDTRSLIYTHIVSWWWALSRAERAHTIHISWRVCVAAAALRDCNVSEQIKNDNFAAAAGDVFLTENYKYISFVCVCNVHMLSVVVVVHVTCFS